LTGTPSIQNVALATVGKLNPEFVARAISELMIKDEFKDLPGSSFEDAKRLLSSV